MLNKKIIKLVLLIVLASYVVNSSDICDSIESPIDSKEHITTGSINVKSDFYAVFTPPTTGRYCFETAECQDQYSVDTVVYIHDSPDFEESPRGFNDDKYDENKYSKICLNLAKTVYIKAVAEVPEQEFNLKIERIETIGFNLTPIQITQIRKITKFNISSKISANALEDGRLTVSLTNTGDEPINDIQIEVQEPEVDNPNIIYINRVWGWDFLKFIGWIATSYVREPKLLEWEISEPQKFDVINPGETVDVDFDIKTPLSKPEAIELKLNILSYGNLIFEEIIPVEVNTTEFLVITDLTPGDNAVDIYMVVSNLQDFDDKYFIELNFNRNSKTTGAEYFGPYRIKSKDTVLFAYKYSYVDEFADSYQMRYTMYNRRGAVKQSEGIVNLPTG